MSTGVRTFGLRIPYRSSDPYFSVRTFAKKSKRDNAGHEEATINKERIKSDNLPLLFSFENDVIDTSQVLKKNNYIDRRPAKLQ